VRVAAVQMHSGPEVAANVARADRLVADAAGRGARLVALPEMFACVAGRDRLRASAEPLDGPTLAWAAGAARRHGIWLLAGSLIEDRGDGCRANTSCLFGPDGERVAVYRKVHRFDVDVPGFTYRESDIVEAGDELVCAELAGTEVAGGGPLRLGLSVCYDLRFAELYRILALRGAQVLAVPSAFSGPTGKDHWEPLLRARAIENQCYVLAPDQWGDAPGGGVWHGRSMIVDPWGVVLAQAPDADGVITADLDLDRLAEVRRRLPALAHRRPEVYRWP
jgi:predicted amidohydrolase